MRTVLFFLFSIGASFYAHAQTLYVPGGPASGGIAPSPNGNVGIGTSNPLSNLHVDGGTGGSSVMIGTTAATNRTSLWLRTEGETGKTFIQSWWAGVNQGSLALNPSGGKVGVGTLTPERNFHIDGGVGGTSVMLGNTTAQNRTSLWLSTEGETGKTSIQSWWAGVNQGSLLLNPNGGNVGIGTTSPGSFRLAVEGKIGAREVNVTTTSPWPDYVFDNDYRLPSLTAVEQFILIHKHLPEVPSAVEVQEKGIDVGEMNAVLLKKIEELTLHMIRLKKENDNLRERMDKFEKRTFSPTAPTVTHFTTSSMHH